MLKFKDKICILMGLLIVSIMIIPYFILGTNSYVEIHDQLDGEVLNYIYHAKYFLNGNRIPEFMGGMSKAAMLPPAPFGILFYLIAKPFYAFVGMQWFVLIIGFLGMYFFCKKCKIHSYICFLVSILFAYMPFYPTYGLAALGQPLLLLCFWNILEGKYKTTSSLGIILYAGFSSLTLVGYVWVILGFGFTIYYRCKKNLLKARKSLFATSLLTITYLLTNLQLLSSLFGQEGYMTHRSEMQLVATGFIGKVVELLFQGGSYSKVYSTFVLIATIIVIFFSFTLIHDKKEHERLWNNLHKINIVFLCIIIGVLLAALWNCNFVVSIRNAIGGMITYFQADRIYWIFPFLWMLLLALVLNAFLIYLEEYHAPGLKFITIFLAILLIAVQGLQILRDNTLNKNMRLLCFSNYKQVTWESFYMEEVFEEIDSIIGEEKTEYQVISLGMYPSIPLYNGYQCADGYSNNYDLAYKHQFRKIIRGELDKNEEVKKYFDDWGNRCYLPTATYGFHGMLGKDSHVTFSDLSFDFEEMKSMHIKYLFSTGEILDADKYGIELVNESPFSSEKSFYNIWVYEIF